MLVLTAPLLASCSSTGGDDGAVTSTTEWATGGPAADGTVPDADSGSERLDVVLQAMMPSGADLATGERSALREEGDLVENNVTLDYCGVVYASETARLARRQEMIYDADGAIRASVEAVFYRSGGAVLAIEEVRGAVASCPEEPRQATVVGVPDMTYRSTPLDPALLSGLVDDHLAIAIAATPEDGPVQNMVSVYQRRGDVLVITYGEEIEPTVDLATAVGARLAGAAEADLTA